MSNRVFRMTVKQIKNDGFTLTNHRALCRRGVMWLGQTCNLRCYFCYFADRIATQNHPEHSFMSLSKAKSICRTLVDVYGNNSIDIQGGEPTIYPHIYDLITYCGQIGLKPTLITNAVSLANRTRCRRLQEAGVFDLLVSIHALGDQYDTIVGVKGASDCQMKALGNLVEEGIPFRVNVTLTLEALNQLDQIVSLSIDKGARVINFIAFNPFIDQKKDTGRDRESIPLYRDIANRLIPLIDTLKEKHIEANVRYLPFCLFPQDYRKSVQNFQQIVYDLHEWESAGEIWSGAAAQRRANDELSRPVNFFKQVMQLRKNFLATQSEFGKSWGRVRQVVRHCLAERRHSLFDTLAHIEERFKKFYSKSDGCSEYKKSFYLPELGEVEGFTELEYAYKEFRVLMPKTIHPYSKSRKCNICDVNGICDGFHKDYANLIGFDEATPIEAGGRIFDPKHYMGAQMKVVEEKEYFWALP